MDRQTDRGGQTKREGNRQTDNLLGQVGCRLETGPYLCGHRDPGLSSAAPPLSWTPRYWHMGLEITFMRPGLGCARRWNSHFGGQPVHIPEVSKNSLEFDPTAFCMKEA